MKQKLVKLLQGLLRRLDQGATSGNLLPPEHLNQVLASAALGFYDWDLQSGEFNADEHWLSILGYQPGELNLNTSNLNTLVDPADTERIERQLFQALDKGEDFKLEFRGVHKLGHLCWIRTTGTVIKRNPQTGAALRVCGAMQDITNVKEGERERNEYLQFFEMASDLMMIGQINGKFLKVNRAVLDTLGYTEDELYAMDLMNLAHPDDLEETLVEISEQMRTGHTMNFENRVRCKDGSFRWLSYRSTYVKESGLSYATARDITESKRFQEELRQQQERNDALMNNTSDVIMEFDRQHRHIYVNGVTQETLGIPSSDFIGKTHEDMGFPHHLCEIWEDAIERVFLTGKPYTTYFEADNPGGTMKVDWSVFPGIVVDGEVKTVLNVSRDITHYMKMEEELQRMRKLSSLGVLAGGIAHDFNNILTILFGNISLAKSHLMPSHSGYRPLEKAEVAFQRATLLTSQLLTFAKGGEPVKQDVSMGDLIQDVVRFDLSGSNVKLIYNAPDDLWHASADKGQISQVFSNLATNAKQAMPAGGHIFITICNRTLDRNAVAGLDAGNYLEFNVRDEGIGISSEHLDKIFDPYFTTKEKGSGLGLATVHSIVTRHGGHISVESTEGDGATFTLYLPAIGTTSYKVEEQAHPQAALPKTHVRVLVMDDEEMIRQLCATYLGSQGYKVDLASEGREAITMYELAQRAGDPYDCLIMDLTIPGGMSGMEALVEIRKKNPAVRAIVSSGYAADPVMANFREHGFSGFIPKPFQLSALHHEIKRVLAG